MELVTGSRYHTTGIFRPLLSITPTRSAAELGRRHGVLLSIYTQSNNTSFIHLRFVREGARNPYHRAVGGRARSAPVCPQRVVCTNPTSLGRPRRKRARHPTSCGPLRSPTPSRLAARRPRSPGCGRVYDVRVGHRAGRVGPRGARCAGRVRLGAEEFRRAAVAGPAVAHAAIASQGLARSGEMAGNTAHGRTARAAGPGGARSGADSARRCRGVAVPRGPAQRSGRDRKERCSTGWAAGSGGSRAGAVGYGPGALGHRGDTFTDWGGPGQAWAAATTGLRSRRRGGSRPATPAGHGAGHGGVSGRRGRARWRLGRWLGALGAARTRGDLTADQRHWALVWELLGRRCQMPVLARPG